MVSPPFSAIDRLAPRTPGKRTSQRRTTQAESLADRRTAVEIHVDHVALVDLRQLRAIAAGPCEITKALMEPGW